MSHRVAPLVASYAAAVGCGLGAASLILVQQGEGPFTLLELMWQSTFASKYAVLDLVRWTTPLLLGGLAFLVAVRAGVWNLGVEGQIAVGALCATLTGIHVPAPGPLAVVLVLASGAIGGAAWTWPAAWLHARRGVNEVVLTLMLNYVALLGTAFCVREFFMARLPDGREIQTLSTRRIRPAAELPAFSAFSAANWSTLVAAVVLMAVVIVLRRTKFGLDLAAVGSSAPYARYAAIPVARRKLQAFVVSGAIAGIVGAIEVQGVLGRFMDGALDNLGFDGMIVSLVAMNNPLAILPSAVFFGALQNAELVISQRISASSYLVMLVAAAFICVFAARPLTRTVQRFAHRRAGAAPTT